MQPHIQNKCLEINIMTRRDQVQSDQQITINSKLFCQKQKILKVTDSLISQSLPQQISNNDQWMFLVELSCNPGCQKQLADFINNGMKQQDNPTMFECALKKITLRQIIIKAYPSTTKVFVNIILPQKYKQRFNLSCIQTIQNIPYTTAHIVLNGQKPEDDTQCIKFHGVEFNFKTQGPRQIASWARTIYNLKQKQPLVILGLLQKLKEGKINLTMTTLQRLDSIFDIVWQQIHPFQFPSKKQLAHNEFKLYIKYKNQFLCESEIKLAHPTVVLKQLKKNVINKY